MRRVFIWLDDIRNPRQFLNKEMYECYEVIWLKSYDEFVKYIEDHGLPARISFDHDLGEYGINERNGYTAANYLVDYCMDHELTLPEYTSHSSNVVGREKILGLLNNFSKFQ